MASVDLKQLRYFIAVAEEASFSRAAAKLHITQPPLSTRIKQLEEEIGVALLERSTRSVQLTEAGGVLLGEARQLFVQLERSLQTTQRVGHGEIGNLALGFVPSAANSAFPPLLKTFRQKYPDVAISLHEMSPAEQVEHLHAKRIDAAFFYLPSGSQPPFGYPDLDSQAVVQEPLVAIFPKGHPLTAWRRIDPGLLAGEPFILVAAHRGPGLRGIILEQCRKAGFMPDVVQEATLIQTIGGLVASGVGIALVPASLRRLQNTGVDYRPLQGEAPTVSMGIVWRRNEVSKILQAFLWVAAQQVENPHEASSP